MKIEAAVHTAATALRAQAAQLNQAAKFLEEAQELGLTSESVAEAYVKAEIEEQVKQLVAELTSE